MKLSASTVAGLCLMFLLSGCEPIAQTTLETGMKVERALAGLDPKQMTINDIQWFYLDSGENSGRESGNRPVVLLVHGFGADGTNWYRFVKAFDDQYRFIVPDLPGHGQSSGTDTMDYSLDLQARRLRELMRSLGVQTFHVVGNSMGGAIALNMALQAPARIETLGLIDSAGLDELTPEFEQLVGDGNNPLIVREADDVFTTIQWAMEKPPYYPEFVLRAIGKEKAERAAVTDRVWSFVQEQPDLEPQLARIDQPSLIVWGAEDRLLPVSSADVFRENLKNSETVILEGIGHLPMLEAPEETARVFSQFWQEYSAGTKTTVATESL